MPTLICWGGPFDGQKVTSHQSRLTIEVTVSLNPRQIVDPLPVLPPGFAKERHYYTVADHPVRRTPRRAWRYVGGDVHPTAAVEVP